MFKIRKSIRASVILFFTLIIIQIIYVIITPDFKINFGAELGRIAESIITGKGYSNPFGETGPTAWHLPILVLLIALIFKISGITLTSYIILAGIKFFAFALSFYFISKALSINGDRWKSILLFMLFLLYFLFSPSQNLVMVCDLWIITLVVSAFIYSFTLLYSESKKGFFLLFIVFFFAPLISPPFALGFIIIISISTLRALYLSYKKPTSEIITNKGISTLTDNRNHPERIILRYLYLIGAFTFATGLWSFRNYVEFKKFIPSKSNMWFEFYITNIVDTDGQLSLSTSYLSHPVTSEILINEIKTMGEINWLEKYHEKSRNYLNNNFADYIENIKCRLFNAFIYIENDMDKIDSDKISKFSDSDQLKLNKAKLIYDRGWISLFYSDKEMYKLLDQIEVQNKELIFKDWQAAKLKYHQLKYSYTNFVRSTFMSIIPMLCLIMLLFIKQIRKNVNFIVSVVLYFIYLIPYILVSHQIRYQRPLFILQVILIYLLIVFVLEKIRPIYTSRIKNNQRSELARNK
jgi:hypothetical protein